MAYSVIKHDLVKNFDGNCFVPRPLPPAVYWTNELVAAVSSAERALGRLGGLGHRFLNPQRLVRMFMKREAELSSRIENTHASVRTQLLFEEEPEIQKDAPDVQEVENNFKAIEFGIESNRPLTLGLIREMHQLLLRGVRGDDKTPGQFRKIQAHIGRTNRIDKARFVPAPPHAIDQCMRDLERYIQHPDGLPTLVRTAMIHYQFEAIHPFSDGNGRIGRVLILLLLFREQAVPLALLNPSAPLERARERYYDLLLGVSQRGEWNAWIEFFARGVEQEAHDSIKRIELLDALRQDYQSRIQTRRASALLPRLVDELFVQPVVRLGDVKRLLAIKAPSAQKLIDKLVEAKILQEVFGRVRNRVYLAPEIVKAFQTVTDQSPPSSPPAHTGGSSRTLRPRAPGGSGG